MHDCVCVVFRVKGGGLSIRPETQLPPLPCYLFPALASLPFLSQFDPISHLPIHLKAQNTYWDPIWGWGREHERALSRSGKNSNNNMMKRRWWKMLRAWTGDFFKWLSSFLFSLSPPCFFLFDALLIGAVSRLGSTARLTQLLQQGRSSNKRQYVGVKKEVCGELLLKEPPSIFHPL